MKLYSTLIICLTLGIFYSLAVYQQNKLNLKGPTTIEPEYKIENLSHEADMAPYLLFDDEFSMHVTGKEHRYLHTGVSFLEYPELYQEKQCLLADAHNQKTNSSGS